jgi:hypothetical protein
MYLPKALTLRGATISEWATGTDPKERAHDMDVAIEVARSAPQVFEAVPFSTSGGAVRRYTIFRFAFGDLPVHALRIPKKLKHYIIRLLAMLEISSCGNCHMPPPRGRTARSDLCLLAGASQVSKAFRLLPVAFRW